MHRLAWLMVGFFNLASPARAYVDATSTLDRLIRELHG
jgi:hypothetical protein